MPEPTGHTLFTEALRVINRAIADHAEASPWQEVIARTSGRGKPITFGVAVHAGDRAHPVDRYLIRVHRGRFEAVERGRRAPAIDWVVSVNHLRRVHAKPNVYVQNPDKLELAWLLERLGIRRQPERAARSRRAPRATPRSPP